MSIMQRLEIEDKYGYTAEADGEIKAPCGCPACDDGIQLGHFACVQSLSGLVKAEAEGLVTRSYDNGAWRWYVTVR